jgi:hypothetical protein
MAQCHATSKGSGQQCRRPAIAGAAVCRVHGGAAPQVKEAARVRLLALVDPALATLARAVNSKRQPTAVEISAAKDILDRAGLAAERPADGAATAPTIQLVVLPAGADPASGSLDIRAMIRGPAPALPTARDHQP